MEVNKIIQGNCLDKLKKLPDNSVDSVCTDPPYGLSKEPDITEVLTKWIAGEDYKHCGSGFMGKCYHPSTEILTQSGWKQVENITQEDKVRSLNPDTDEIEYTGVINTFQYDYEGDLVRIEGRSVSQLITPNHNIYVKKARGDYHLIRADALDHNIFYMKNQGV